MECEAIKERTKLTWQIARACVTTDDRADQLLEDYEPGSEQAMNHMLAVLQGIVAEYRFGGDQLTEGCTCGQHIDRP
jgi:hypothetical protein